MATAAILTALVPVLAKMRNADARALDTMIGYQGTLYRIMIVPHKSLENTTAAALRLLDQLAAVGPVPGDADDPAHVTLHALADQARELLARITAAPS